MSAEVDKSFLYWMYAGVNNSLAGNGGQECIASVPPLQRLAETVAFTALGLVEMYVAYPRLQLPSVESSSPSVLAASNRTGRNLLLAVMCLTFGIELGFKFATRQMIWILNPCHITTAIQIWLLVAPASRTVTALFRIHMHFLFGATIALLLPVINTRLLPFETSVYFLQHLLILIIPFYLMRLGGVYTVEKFSDWSWLAMSLGLLFVYHYIILQGLALLTEVNLNNMLCPAVSDPFYGRFYRIWAAIHQTALISIHGKLYALLASWVLSWNLFTQPTQSPAVTTAQPTSNGHVKHR